jgi:hypothetical protein
LAAAIRSLVLDDHNLERTVEAAMIGRMHKGSELR